jgi:hypothetical protein
MQHSLRVVTADALTTLQQGLLLEISKSLPPSLSPRSLSHIEMKRSDGHPQSNGGGHFENNGLRPNDSCFDEKRQPYLLQGRRSKVIFLEDV